MTIYNKVATLSNINAAYIAGIIDGEGTITLTSKHKNGNRQLAITISNTEMPLLEFIFETIEAGKITNKKVYKDNHTPSMTYAISNRQALDLLSQITPYLKTYKKQRAELILKDYVRVTPRNGKYNDNLKIERERFIEAFFEISPWNEFIYKKYPVLIYT